MFSNERELEDRLSTPTPEATDTMHRLQGDVILLGVAGKMGPSLARMVRRASDAAGVPRRVIGVARFSQGGEADLRVHGVETIACNLLDPEAIERLPDVANVIFMTGMKFGTANNPGMTWAMNTLVPGWIGWKYRHSKILAFSTGNVYGLTSVTGGGSRETDVPAPVGEYAMSALGRERIFEHCSTAYGIPTALLRLNYACDLRYGVLVDLAQQVLAEQPIDLGMGYFNTIWQGDANAMTLCAFDHLRLPANIINMTGPELLSVREVCERFGKLLRRKVAFLGSEGPSALLSNVQSGIAQLGALRVSAEQLIEWVAKWVQDGGRLLGKPTHFESREGRF